MKARDGGSSKTLLISDRSFFDVAASDSDSVHFPIIKDIGNLGSEMDNYLPKRTRGQIVLDVSPGSLGYERRLVDWFQRYEPIGQEITVYGSYLDLDGVINPSSAGEAIAVTRIENWSLRAKSKELIIYTDSDPIPDKTITHVLEADGTLPDGSVGQALPIVIGSGVECKAIPLSADPDSCPYGLASTFGNIYGPKIYTVSTTYKIKDASGEYRDLKSGTSVGYDPGSLTSSNSGLGTIRVWDISQWIGPQSVGVTHAAIKIRGNGLGGSASGYYELHIYDENENTGGPNEEPLAVAKIDKSLYSAEITGSTSGTYTIWGVFNRLVILDPYKVYFLGFANDANATGADQVWYRYLAAADQHEWWKNFNDDVSASNPASFTRSANQNRIFVSLSCLNFSTSSQFNGNNDLGLSYWRTIVSQDSAPAGQNNLVDVSTLDLIATVNGITDDYLGTYTSSAFSQITKIKHAVNVLGQTYNGSTWQADSIIDVSTYATELDALSTRGLLPTGRTTGRTSYRKFLEDICRSCACRVGLRQTGLSLFAYGTRQASKGVITDKDADIVELTCLAASKSVVNRHIFNFDPKLSSANLTNYANKNDLRDFAGYLARSESDGGWWADLFKNSTSTYGVRELGSDRFYFIKDSTHAQELSKIVAGLQGRSASWLVLFDVPLIKYLDLGLDIFGVWELMHPDMPAFYGTSSRSKGEYYSTTEAVQDFYPDKRAEIYRIAIEGRTINWRGPGYVPTFRVLARVLLDDLEPL